MVWSIVTVKQMSSEWQRSGIAVRSRLLKVSYQSLNLPNLLNETQFPRAYLRLVYPEQNIYTNNWITLYPKKDIEEVISINLLEGFGQAFIELKKRGDRQSTIPNYVINVDQYLESPYIITNPLTLFEQVLTLNGLEIYV